MRQRARQLAGREHFESWKYQMLVEWDEIYHGSHLAMFLGDKEYARVESRG